LDAEVDAAGPPAANIYGYPESNVLRTGDWISWSGNYTGTDFYITARIRSFGVELNGAILRIVCGEKLHTSYANHCEDPMEKVLSAARGIEFVRKLVEDANHKLGAVDNGKCVAVLVRDCIVPELGIVQSVMRSSKTGLKKRAKVSDAIQLAVLYEKKQAASRLPSIEAEIAASKKQGTKETEKQKVARLEQEAEDAEDTRIEKEKYQANVKVKEDKRQMEDDSDAEEEALGLRAIQDSNASVVWHKVRDSNIANNRAAGLISVNSSGVKVSSSGVKASSSGVKASSSVVKASSSVVKASSSVVKASSSVVKASSSVVKASSSGVKASSSVVKASSSGVTFSGGTASTDKPTRSSARNVSSASSASDTASCGSSSSSSSSKSGKASSTRGKVSSSTVLITPTSSGVTPSSEKSSSSSLSFIQTHCAQLAAESEIAPAPAPAAKAAPAGKAARPMIRYGKK